MSLRYARGRKGWSAKRPQNGFKAAAGGRGHAKQGLMTRLCGDVPYTYLYRADKVFYTRKFSRQTQPLCEAGQKRHHTAQALGGVVSL